MIKKIPDVMGQNECDICNQHKKINQEKVDFFHLQ